MFQLSSVVGAFKDVEYQMRFQTDPYFADHRDCERNLEIKNSGGAAAILFAWSRDSHGC